MTEQELEKLRFPTGRFVIPAAVTPELLAKYIADIEAFPARLRKETAHLTDEQLDTPYRAGGWTIRQVVHHCADSHLNAYTRLKLTLTEDRPVIKPYHEDLWAELNDAKTMPVQPSLQLLEGLHTRWAASLKALTEKDLEKVFIHPEQKREYRLGENIALYAWHCNHHLAHITTLKKSRGWQ